MSYENPQQPEGINVSDEHPERELFVLLGAVVTTVVVLVILLSSIAGWLARYVPFSTEMQIAETVGIVDMFTPAETNSTSANEQADQRKTLIQQLSRALIEKANLDEELVVTVHYNPAEVVNAYATLGGHVVMYEGLLARLPNENALAMVLAHEIAHIKLRHPIVAMGRGLTISLALSSVFGLTDNAAVGQLVQWIGYSSTLSFSRDQEREADNFASELLIEHYGHLNGAEDLFIAFDEDSEGTGSSPTAEFLSTHPGLVERIHELRQRATELGSSGSVTPLPWLTGR